VRDQETKKEFTDWLILTEFQDSLVKMDEDLMAVCVCTCACVCMGGGYLCARVHVRISEYVFMRR